MAAAEKTISIPLTRYERAMVHNFLTEMSLQTGQRLSAEAEDRIYDLLTALDAASLEGASLKDTETALIPFAFRDAEWLRDRYQESQSHRGGLALGLVPAIRKLRQVITETTAKKEESEATS